MRPESAPATAPAQDERSLTRSSRGVERGLWALRAVTRQSGTIQKSFQSPLSALEFDTLTVDVMHDSGRGKSNAIAAAVVVEDAHGIRKTGDFFPVTAKWTTVPFDLRHAAREGMDLAEIAKIGVTLRVDDRVGPVEIVTDYWAMRASVRRYWPVTDTPPAAALASAKGFYADREGGQLRVGVQDLWELRFHRRAGQERPWMEVTRGKNRQLVVGGAGTGLMILDQEGWNGIEKAVQRGAVSREAAGVSAAAGAKAPTHAWPGADGDRSTWDWRVAWTSALAVQVDVKQTSGRFDDLGRPAAVVNWKFTVYRSGQVYVHAEWEKAGGADVVDPVTWALVLDKSTVEEGRKPPDRLLTNVYPPEFRAEVMPHQMQVGNPLAMLARSDAGEANLWWWADAGNKRIFGVGLPRGLRNRGPVDCLLLVNDLLTSDKDSLATAATFSQYLVPPALKFRTGSLDRDFPGDRDNDGVVEAYGFQVVRLANGRAMFTISPGERPLVWPVFLLTVPPEEREAVDLKHSHVLVNVDGKQFEDPPQWPDGSFIWQYPGMILRPVVVEVTLVRK